MRAARVILALACVAAGPGDDLQRLIGTWRGSGPDVEWEVNFDGQFVQIAISGKKGDGFTGAGVGPLTEVKEDGGGRYIELAEITARGAQLPQRVDYRFDGGDLVLDVGDGYLKGEHRLTRVAKPSLSGLQWVLLALAAGVAVLVIGVTAFRKRSRA